MSWDTGDKCNNAEDCSWAEQFTGSVIYISPEVQSVIRELCNKVKTEWQMLLTGEEKKDGVYVTGYWIPKQEVTTSTVTNLDVVDKAVIAERKIVCTIHSHADMGVFFSGVDEKFTNNSLIKNHIVVNNKGQMKATMRYELPCKMVHFFDAEAQVIMPDGAEVEGMGNITQKKYGNYKGGFGNKWWAEEEYKGKWDTDGRKMKKKKKQHHASKDRGKLNKHGVIIYP